MKWRIGIDVGGTFTDFVAIHHDDIRFIKVPTTPEHPFEGIINALELSAIPGDDILSFAHGTTVATNALLERQGACTATITSAGFRDLLEIGRQNRPSLYDLDAHWPPPLVPRKRRFTIEERMGPSGMVKPMAEGAIEAVIAMIAADPQIESVAICLLFGYLHTAHEQRLLNILQLRFPDLHISASHRVAPEFREFERLSTTVADAYLAPVLSRYLDILEQKLRSRNITSPLIMQSSGGIAPMREAMGSGAACVLSGPAAGAFGASYIAALSGFRDVLAFDMGGTSTDVCLILDSKVTMTTERWIAGMPIRLPTVDIHTISAGGGSIGWRDSGNALQTGPRSAGATPGPAAYGLGGSKPTITDANLLLGYLPNSGTFGQKIVLQRRFSEQALSTLGRELDMNAMDTAEGMLEIVNHHMHHALRIMSVDRGIDPSSLALMAFGGAGPLHACRLAEMLSIDTILVARACGVLSALGLASADLRRDYQLPVHSLLCDWDEKDALRAFQKLELRAFDVLESPEFSCFADVRYHGQSFELTIPAWPWHELHDRFEHQHQQRFKFSMPDQAIELINIRLTATQHISRPPLREILSSSQAQSATEKATIRLDGKWREVPLWNRTALGINSRIEGPALILFPEATCLVRPGWQGTVDNIGTLVLSFNPGRAQN